jgi:hypothetical protein
MNDYGKPKTVVMALDKRILLATNPGLIDRGTMLGIPEDVTLELLVTITDIINMHISLTEDLGMVEDEMYNVFEFMTDPYLPGQDDHLGGYKLDDYNRVVYDAMATLRAMIPLNITNLRYLPQLESSLRPDTFYVGGVCHAGNIPDDYMLNEQYFLFM